MVNTFKNVKNEILATLKENSFELGIQAGAIIEAGNETSDAIPMPFVYCDFDYGTALVVGGYVCDLEVNIFIGCENASVGEAKEDADVIASKILKILLEKNLIKINTDDKFKEFFSESSQRAGIRLILKSEIISH